MTIGTDKGLLVVAYLCYWVGFRPGPMKCAPILTLKPVFCLVFQNLM